MDNTHLNAENAAFVEGLYEAYLADPSSLPDAWRRHFEEVGVGTDVSHAEIRRRFAEHARARTTTPSAAVAHPGGATSAHKQSAVLKLITFYRLMGHLRADLDPINLRGLPPVPELDPFYHGLTEDDLDTVFDVGEVEGPRDATLREILEMLKTTYTGPIGCEYMHIIDLEMKQWLQHRLEQTRCTPRYEKLFKRYLLEQLTAAEGLERYLHTKYAGQKRFSLEGGETLLPLLEAVIQQAGGQGVQEIALGMAHRGRLNVLTNLMGKAPKDIFMEFEGRIEPSELTTGDVRYHEGFSVDVQTEGGPMHLSLAFNPSHLEIIDPVVLGSVRARQDRRNDEERGRVFAVLLHGDAALAGQGVVYESMSLSQTRGFSTGGTIHVVVNNRIGFTLSNPRDLRSTLYCTDVGKVVQAPIFHVNGDDPEAVVFVAQLAVEYRMRFHRDVVIDLICFRRHGHNEADEPAATQPMMYSLIRKHPGVRQVYAEKLIKENVVTAEDAEEMIEVYRTELDAGHPVSENRLTDSAYPWNADWLVYLNRHWTEPAETKVSLKKLKRLGDRITSIPEGVALHPRVEKVIAERRQMAAGERPMDWGCAETLAYATLLEDGHPVRVSGQDSGRGTFFHRHAVLHNQRNGAVYIPLAHVSEKQARFSVIDSILSEEAVLGFEYGYATTDPKTLVLWEAQFGDFANVAQVVIDQFISSSEQKWNKVCGVVLMLPHGWEGQGPEHSSARLERFLQLCAQENMQVCNPTTPAQMFHLLRRQMIRSYRKPLIIMSPKSTLRRKLSFSSIDELANGGFKNVIGEIDPIDPRRVRRIIMCSGKVYYDLLEARRAREEEKIAIIRIEQLYPFPEELLIRELRLYPHAREIVWTQEEPMNQGCWDSIYDDIRNCMSEKQSLAYAGRLANAAPAGGYYQKHNDRQKRLVDAALNLDWTDPHPIVIFQPQKAPNEVVRR